jgi:hypothetical protein
VQGEKGLQAKFSDPNDVYLRVYGTEILSIATPYVKTFTGLKSKAKYQLKYYCFNQMSKVSDAVSVNFVVPDNGAFLMKITLWF